MVSTCTYSLFRIPSHPKSQVLNRSVEYRRIWMDSICSVKNLLNQGCYMASIDLQDAYLHIPIAARSQKYLRLALKVGKKAVHLQIRALPFGLSSSKSVHKGNGRSVGTFASRSNLSDSLSGQPAISLKPEKHFRRTWSELVLI